MSIWRPQNCGIWHLSKKALFGIVSKFLRVGCFCSHLCEGKMGGGLKAILCHVAPAQLADYENEKSSFSYLRVKLYDSY